MEKSKEKQLMGKISYGHIADWWDYRFHQYGSGKSYTLTYKVKVVYSQCPWNVGDFFHLKEFHFASLAEVKWFLDHKKESSYYKGYELYKLMGVKSSYKYEVEKTNLHCPFEVVL